MRKINLLNGDCALEAWKQCALAGETLVWRENYLHGRLPDTADLTAFNSIRAEELHTIANGATAGRLWHRYLEGRTGLAAEVLPSTSPANASWSTERLVERWTAALAVSDGPGGARPGCRR